MTHWITTVESCKFTVVIVGHWRATLSFIKLGCFACSIACWDSQWSTKGFTILFPFNLAFILFKISNKQLLIFYIDEKTTQVYYDCTLPEVQTLISSFMSTIAILGSFLLNIIFVLRSSLLLSNLYMDFH